MIRPASLGLSRIAAVFIGTLVLLVAAASAADPAAPIPTISSFLGPEGEDLGGERFATAVSRAGVAAKEVAGKVAAWRQSPVAGRGWLAGVTAGFGERAHAYAFRFSGSGALERVAHVPYGKTPLPGGSRVWVAPVDRIAAAIADGPRSRLRADRPPLRITINRAERTAAATPAADVRIFEAIAWAAACEAGWMPTGEPAATEASLAVEAGVKSFSFRLGVASGGRRQELQKVGVSPDDVHETLRRLFAAVAPQSPVADTFRLGPDAVILASLPDRVVFTADGLVRSLDAHAGRSPWADDPKAPKSRAGSFVARRGTDDAVQIVRWRPTLGLVDPTDGSIRPLAPLVPAGDWAFDIAQAGTRAIVASGSVVAAFDDGKEAWRHEESEAVTCGPAIVGDLVIAGNVAGELFALTVAGGAAAWRQRLEAGLFGRPIPAGELVLVFARGSDTLIAVEATTGRQAWAQPLGDALVKPPVATAAGILVATKSNRVLLLDPQSGKARAERLFTAWIGDVVPLAGVPDAAVGYVACLTRDGTLTLLRGTDLEPLAVRRLNVRPGYASPAHLIAAVGFPLAVPGPVPVDGEADELEAELVGGLGESGDCLLAADEQGYAWIVPLARLTEDRR